MPGDETDVRYVLRADDSNLSVDLSQAETAVRNSAQRSEQALDGISEAAARAGNAAAEASEKIGKSNEESGRSTEETQKKYKSYAEELDEVNRLLEKDSKNTVLLSQKKELLKKAAAETAEKLRGLHSRLQDVTEQYQNGQIPEDEYRRFQREIAATQQELGAYQDELNKIGHSENSFGDELSEVNKLLEKDSKNTTLLAQKKELLNKAISETADKLSALKTRQQEVDRAYQNGDIPDGEYRAFQREIAATQQELEGYRSELNRVGSASDETAEKTDGKLGKAFGTIGKAAAAASAAVGAAVVEVGTAAVKSADSLDKAVNHVVAATGASEEAVKKYEDVIKGVYSDNFGESFEDIADSISKITQNLGEMDEVTLQNVTERAYALQDVFDMGVDESARAAKAMRDNFGISAAEAYDYIAKGAQDGLDYSGELIDSINEYSVQFAKLGFSADDMFNIFSQGAENGAWNLDKIGDAVKEFSIRAIDGSDATREGFQAIGYDADDMMKKFAAGGDVARDAFQTVVSALAAIEDPIARDAAGVNLFGTMWEDLGVEAVAALGDISDSAYDCKGAMDGIMEVNYGSLSDALGGLQRQVETLIQPLGEMLIQPVSDVIEALSGMADEVIPRLVEALKPVLENLTPLIAPIMELITSLLPQLVELVTPIIEMISGLIQTVLPPLTEFLGETLIPIIIELVQWFEEDMFPIIQQLIEWLTESLFPVLQEVLEELMPPIMEILSALTPVLQTVLDILLPILDLILGLISPILQLVNEAIAPLITELLGLINDILQPLMPLIQAVAIMLTDRLGNAIGFITDILGTAFKFITDTISNIRDYLSGIIDFVVGIFTGDWEKAWNGVSKIFESIWNQMKSVAEFVVNGIIDIINGFISGINTMFGWLGVSVEPLTHVDWTADDAEKQALEAVESYGETSKTFTVKENSAGSWRNAEYAAKAGYDTNGNKLNTEHEKEKAVSAPTTYSYTPYIPQTATPAASSSSATSTAGKSDSGGQFVSITSYVPTMWDNDQTAALKSLIGKDVLGNTTTAHQINELTGAISMSAQSTADSGETNLADVVNAISKLQKRVDTLGKDIGDITIELKARDLTIGKAAVRDINDMAKQSGKSPFKF